MWLLDTNALIHCNKLNPKPFKKDYTYTTIFSVIEYPIASKLKEIYVFYPTSSHYKNGLEYASILRKKGTPIRAVDILIGTIAKIKEMGLVTNDSDFNYLQKVEPKLNLISIEEYVKRFSQI